MRALGGWATAPPRTPKRTSPTASFPDMDRLPLARPCGALLLWRRRRRVVLVVVRQLAGLPEPLLVGLVLSHLLGHDFPLRVAEQRLQLPFRQAAHLNHDRVIVVLAR